MGGARPVSVGLFLGLTVTSIGGPLALIALYIPQALDGAGSSAGLSTLMATLVFLFPLAVWYRYSESIASSGGLYAFVEAATGPAVARVQAAFWIFSYFLYLVYTVPFIVYDLLPVAFPASSHYRPLLDVCLVLLICAVMLSPLIITLSLTALLAAFQAVVAVLLTVLTLAHLGAPATSFVGHGNLTPVLQGAGRISSLYICASLPLFLGGEVRGGGKAVRQGIAWAFFAIAALTVIAVFPLANARDAIINANIPGAALAQAFSGQGLATLVVAGVAVSVAGLIVAEFLALSRLLSAMFKQPSRSMVVVVLVPFLAGSLLSLLNPPGAYDLLLKPSLIALWISQLLVVAVYPWFVRRSRKLLIGDVALATAASLVMAVGLYIAVTSGSGT